MRRGTTPTLIIQTDFDWTGYTLQLTIEEGEAELVIEGDMSPSEQSCILPNSRKYGLTAILLRFPAYSIANESALKKNPSSE